MKRIRLLPTISWNCLQNFIDRIQSELGLEIPVKALFQQCGNSEMPQANMDMVRRESRPTVYILPKK